MKIRLLSFALLASSFTFGQLYTPNGNLTGSTSNGSTGNVGVGISNPESKLTIYNNGLVGSNQLELRTGHNRNPDRFFMKNTIYGSGKEDVTFSLRHDGQMFVDGNVGIGIKNPAHALDVLGDVQFGDIISRGSNSWIFHTPDDGIKTLYIAYNGTNGWDLEKAFTISGDTGNAALKGKLEAKELKVTATPTADFVFEETYDLPKLEEVEQHIREKKHLPAIASAKEMEKEGVNVGEFQIKLLQKIEELTLYSIEQNKQLKELQQENKILKSQYEEIKELKRQFQQLLSTKK
ncbi:intermediate filament family protein [Chryseobacterium fistulae]|uniref:Cell wall anchor protein n=1 Tax=Chryseobacterium fistulae TaxID=2675058 RepID=A0A6N4XQR5_9FLAO|nr:keratin [Chryseobacterium fistulae]CAA7386975.1 hypothetical protein CHRY9393_01276 [Chryseobacterium fistulae]